MSEANVQWIKGKTFIGTDSTKHAIVLSAADAENGTGVKPSDLLLLALASCTAVDVVEILQKKRQPPERMEIRIAGKQDADPPWTFREITMHFRFEGAALQQHAVEQAIALSEEKYCSVAATIRGIAKISTTFEIIPSPASALA